VLQHFIWPADVAWYSERKQEFKEVSQGNIMLLNFFLPKLPSKFRIKSWFTILFQDVVTENEFEKKLLSDVIPPSDIGVSFDDIGALENVKETLKELVMLPLQRPELFDKGQLTKVPFIAIRIYLLVVTPT